jgi:hypothetical protein
MKFTERDKEVISKALDYLKSPKGETIDVEMGLISFSEEKEIIENLVSCIGRHATDNTQ